MYVHFFPGAVSRVCFFISVGFFKKHLLASFPSQGGSRGWPLSLSNSQKASVCSSTVYPQEEGYFAICMASTLYLNPKSNIHCMRLFFPLISLPVWPTAQSLLSVYQPDPNCYLKLLWLISPHRPKQNNPASVFTLFLLPSWCVLSIFSSSPCLLSSSQQYDRNWFMKCTQSPQSSFSVTNEHEEKKNVLNSGGKKAPFSFGTSNFFHLKSENRDRFID